jgi:4-hydroxybenzoate polyprenyltransferase
LIASLYFVSLLIEHWALLLATAVFTFLYTAPKIPVPPFTLLRKIAYGKTAFLALAWMHITTQLPLLMVETDWQLPQYLFALHRFGLIYTICILFDLRDRNSDRKEGIKSMVTQMSPPQVGVIYYGMLLFYFVCSLWLWAFLSPGATLALLIPGTILLFCYGWFTRQSSEYVFYFLLDGLMVISLPLMLLFPF